MIWMRNDRGLVESHGNRHGIEGHKTAAKTSYEHNSISWEGRLRVHLQSWALLLVCGLYLEAAKVLHGTGPGCV